MKKRRQYSAEFKRQIVKETGRPGASIAGIALSHGINANIVHRWRRDSLGIPKAATKERRLLPVAVIPNALTADDAPPLQNSDGVIDIELPHARLTLRGRLDLDILQTVLAALRPR